MSRTLRWLTIGACVSLCLAPSVHAQAPASDAGAVAIDVPLPHVSRLNGTGAMVQRDTEEADVVAGEHLAFGDRITTGDAQVQVIWSDGSLVSLDRRASLAVLSPDLLALTEGRLLVVSARQADVPLRLDLPAGTVIISAGTEARISIEGAVAELQVVHGTTEVRHADGTRVVSAGEQLTFRDGLAPGSPVAFNTAGFDTFVEWAREPVVALERSPSRAYLADPRLEAYSDVFDRYGQWQHDATFGQVWFPAVGQDWRPFSQGYWQPFGGAYGPTWVGLDPWGWPTHHYGAWDVNGGGRWFWRPGRQWSPGRVTWSVGPGYVGWSPIGGQGASRWAWNALANPARASQRGLYPGGTLDPFRAWTVIPTERFGARGGLSPYAVDARTLSNLNAFVTQRVAPPLRYGGFGGGFGGFGGATVVGPGGGFGGYPGRATGRGLYGTPTGADTTRDLRRGIPPTRVDPPVPGPFGPGPSAAPDNPYERAQDVMVPRGRQRSPASTDRPRSASPRRPTPQSDPAGEATPRRPPAGGDPQPSARSSRRPPAATPSPATAPPSRGLASPRQTSGARQTPRRAVGRPPN